MTTSLTVLLTQFLQDSGKFPTASSREFLLQVYLPIMVWMIIVFIFIVLLIRKYTFGNWTKENPNPYEGETFNMPRGVLRGTLTLTLLFVVVILELVSAHTLNFETQIEQLLVAFQMMIAFYFGSKVMHHVTSADRDKKRVLAESKIQQHEALARAEIAKAKSVSATTIVTDEFAEEPIYGSETEDISTEEMNFDDGTAAG